MILPLPVDMNKYDSIRYLADGNAKRFCPLRVEDVEEVENKGIPYFCIKRSNDRYGVEMFNYKTHDNAPRMPHYCNYILNHVLPNISKEFDVTGVYQIELHDTYTYLGNGKDYDNALVFAKNSEDRFPCLVPDPFMIDNYGGRLNIPDTTEFENKHDRIVFAGGTTGNTDPSKNQRLRVCEWSLGNRSFTEFHITHVAQMREDAVRNVYVRFSDMFVPPLAQAAQYAYKYILSIDGNTACWDRLMWIINSKSLAMKYSSKDILWYYPLLQEGHHYVGVDMQTMHNKFMFCQSNPSHVKWMISNANAFARDYGNHLSTLLYTARLFENFAMNKQ